MVIFPTQNRVLSAYTLSASRNDRKGKHISTFFQKSSAWQGLIQLFFSVSDTSRGRSRNLDFDNIDVAKKPQGDDPNTNLRSRENFVGHMQQLVFNGNHYFELARTGGLQNIKTSATFDKKDKLVKYPVTFSSTQAYLKTRLRIYSTFSIYFQIKTTQPNGLVLYCGGGSGKDFFTVELVKGHIRFIYDTGSGPKIVRSPLVNGINDNKWHDVGILRPTLHQMILRVDDESRVDILPDDRSVHFDTEDLIYIGGIGDEIFNLLPRQVKSREGFQGCLASFDFDSTSRNILEQRTAIPEDYQGDIVEGCHGKYLDSVWISNYIHYKMWDEITYPFLNFNGATVEV